jgi:nucleotide-binding universal stress UspA family protein
VSPRSKIGSGPVLFPITKSLLPVDFSERASQAVRFAVPVAERFDSEIIPLHVLPPYRDFGAIEMVGAIEMAAVTPSGAAPVPARETRSVSRAASIVGWRSGARDRGLRVALRSRANHDAHPRLWSIPPHAARLGHRQVLHDADCPVRPTAHAETPTSRAAGLQRILCAIDLGPSGADALYWSAQLAAEFGAHLTLVHAMGELDPRTEGYYFSPEWRKFLVDGAEKEIAALEQKAGTMPRSGNTFSATSRFSLVSLAR